VPNYQLISPHYYCF